MADREGVDVAESTQREWYWLYRIYGEDDLLLYVGITVELDRRLRTHARTQPWWQEAVAVTQQMLREETARRLERAAIQTEYPLYNNAMRVTPECPRRRLARRRGQTIAAWRLESVHGRGVTQRQRMREHRSKTPWWSEVASVTTERYGTRSSADAAESRAIWREGPRHNIAKRLHR